MSPKTQNYAIILAGGVGSRLCNLTKHYPKSLIKVNGRAILDYQIKGYLNAGIKEENIYIVIGYKHEMISEFLALHYPKIRPIHNVNYLKTNNMYSLYLGLNEVIKQNPQCLFINNADCIYETNLMKEFIEKAPQNAIAVEFANYNDESMKVIALQNKRLTHIAKNISKSQSLGVSIDLYKFCRLGINALLRIIKDFIEVKGDLSQWSEVAFPPLFKKLEVMAFDIGGKKWVEVDNEDDLALADKLFSEFDLSLKKALICDLDGTLYVGNKGIENSINFIKNSTQEIYFFTNNSSKIPSDYVKKLRSFSVIADLAHILTPLKALISYVKEKGFVSIYLVANAKVTKYLQDSLPKVNFTFNKDKNQAVVLTYDTELNYTKLKNICELLQQSRKIAYIATHSDKFCPSECGKIPDIGSFIALLKTTINKTPSVILGKPNPTLAKAVLEKYQASQIAVIGDRLHTDKKFADKIGADFICVLTGETKRLDVQRLKSSFPSLIINDLGKLDENLQNHNIAYNKTNDAKVYESDLLIFWGGGI